MLGPIILASTIVGLGVSIWFLIIQPPLLKPWWLNYQEQMEMPRYKCHKTVFALKIVSLKYDSDEASKQNRDTDGSATITPEEPYGSFKVDGAYVHKHDPQVGGYYVVYDDGYASFSPAGPFESGYTRISPVSPMRSV